MNRKIFSTGTFARFFIGVMVLVVLASCGGGSGGSSTSTTITPATNNSVALTVGFGPNGQSSGITNGLFTTVTVCQHGTSNCATIPNVLVDTGSVGLRIVSSEISSLMLPTIADQTQDELVECVQYGDTSYSWGPMQLADVQIAGETASNIAIQALGAAPSSFTVPATCLTTPVNPNLPNGGNEDTVATLGANGILGIGDAAWDCGTSCVGITTGSTYAGYPYYICPTGQACEEIGVPTSDQAVNPVAFFSSSDTNGVMIYLPSVGATGATSVPGTMYFGVGTQSDNALGTATLYAMDPCGYFPTVTYGGLAYTDTSCSSGTGGIGGILDTGSNPLFVSDATTLGSLGISDCAQGTAGYGYYCVTNGPATLSNIALSGYNGVGSGNVSLSIADATTLFTANPTFAVFNNLGTDSGTSPATDFFDLGLPFFLGRTVSIGIAGGSVPNGASAPYGFVAF